MNQEQRDEIVEELFNGFPIVESDEDIVCAPGTLTSWGLALGHELDDERRCKTCGRGITCPVVAFHDALVASVVRELAAMGRLSPMGTTLIPKVPFRDRVLAQARERDLRGPVTWCEHDDDRHDRESGCIECRCVSPRGHGSPGSTCDPVNDPFGIWGIEPSYRCYMNRHRQCEPHGADKGCTCSCGHHSPVCACGTREVRDDGTLVHHEQCPSNAKP